MAPARGATVLAASDKEADSGIHGPEPAGNLGQEVYPIM